MSEQWVRTRAFELESEGRLKLVTSRECFKADLQGLKEIVLADESISLLRMQAGMFGGPTLEKFYTSDDENFNKQAREFLLKIGTP